MEKAKNPGSTQMSF